MIRTGVLARVAFVMIAALALSPAPAAADRDDPKAPSAIDVPAGISGVTANVVSGAHGLEVEGRFEVKASPALAWSVLTNYDSIESFVSSMRESRVTKRGDGYVLVEQVAVGHLLFM